MSGEQEYVVRTVSLMVVPRGRSVFDEMATRVSVTDESGGEFVEIEQECGKIRIDPAKWPSLRRAIDRMVRECRPGETV